MDFGRVLSDLQATQGVIVLLVTTSGPWGTLLSVVVTNAYVLYYVTKEVSLFSSQLGFMDPTTWNVFNQPKASYPVVPYIQSPFALLDHVSLSQVFLPAAFQENKPIPFVHLYPF